MKSFVKKKSKYILILFIACFFLLTLKLFYLTFYRFKDFKTMTDSQYGYSEKTSDLNYLLLDHTGKELLDYYYKYYVVIDPNSFLRSVNDMDIDSEYALTYTLKNYNSKYTLPSPEDQNTSKKLYYEVDKNTYDKIKKINGLRGVYSYMYSAIDRSNVWKIENLISDIQKTDKSGLKSKQSLEMMLADKTSKNKYTTISFKSSVDGSISSGTYSINKDNINVRLTLDKNIEDKIQEILSSDKYKSSNEIGVILMEADTGKIRAMVQKDYNKDNVLLGGVGNGYVPGSIFKTIVEEAALENSSINLGETFKCTGRYEGEGGESHGTLTLPEAYEESCNDTFSQIGNKTGYDAILRNAQNQGLLSKNKVLSLEYEKSGEHHVPQSSGELSLFSIGQSINITPIQAISIPNTVVNHGVYVKPYLIDAYVDNDNNVIENNETEKKRVISESTANELKSQMTQVIKSDKGTGRLANIDGLELGGKTGTSTRQIPSEKDPNVKENHSDGWFAGFFKGKEHYYSMVVFVKDINKATEEAGNTAAPLFKDIVEKINNELGK